MSHEAAVREALTRYLTETPASGLLADRLARTARTTLSLYDQAVGIPGANTAWADHNLYIRHCSRGQQRNYAEGSPP